MTDTFIVHREGKSTSYDFMGDAMEAGSHSDETIGILEIETNYMGHATIDVIRNGKVRQVMTWNPQYQTYGYWTTKILD